MTEGELLRDAYRRMFNPEENDRPLSEVERGKVMADLGRFCCFDRAFEVSLAGSDIPIQLALQEGKRSVFLRILKYMDSEWRAREPIAREGIVE